MPTFAFVAQTMVDVVFSPREAFAQKIVRGRAFADSFDLMDLSLQFD
jgi:hypothetical protein